MGLDITYYTGLARVRERTSDDDRCDCPDGLTSFYDNADFPGRIGSIDPNWLYSYGERHCFRAGSYSGYSAWRDMLAGLVGIEDLDVWWKNPQPGSFAELLNFADNEGTIGPESSAKLARDFAEHQATADAHPDPWFREMYAVWRRAFEAAANDGAVAFH